MLGASHLLGARAAAARAQTRDDSRSIPINLPCSHHLQSRSAAPHCAPPDKEHPNTDENIPGTVVM